VPESELRYQALVEHAPDAVVVLDLGLGRFVTVNPAAERLFGMSRAELLQVGPVEVSPPVQPDGRPSAQAASEYIAQALAGEQPRFEWTHRRADGTAVPCEINLLRLPAAGRQLVRGSILDITDRRDAEQARRRAETEAAGRAAADAAARRLRSLIDGLQAIVWVRDARTWQVGFVNDRAEELLGYPVSDWLADPQFWSRILHPEDRDAAIAGIQAATAANADQDLFYRVITADRRVVWLHDLVHVVCGEDGRPAQLHGVMIDVTAGKQAQQAAELLAQAGTLLAEPGAVPDKLARITRLALGPLAESASVSLVAPDGTLQQVTIAHADLEIERALRALPPSRLAASLAGPVQSGRPFTVEVTNELLRESGLAESDAEVLLRTGLRRALTLPLFVDGRVLGLLALGGTATRSWDGTDLALAEELGRRIAVMLATDRLAQRSRQRQALTTALAAAESVADVAAALLAGVRTAFEATAMSVYRRDVDGRLVLVDAVGYPPEVLERYEVIGPDAPVPLADCARTGELVWLRNLAGWEQRYPQLVGVASRAGTRAIAAVPIRAGQSVVGAMGLSFGTARDFPADEHAFALALAGQAGDAINRAQAADERRHIAETLQRGLLPAALPAIPGVELATRYRAHGEYVKAGGDFYDVLRAAGGWACIVGDVCGKGPEAAALTGLCRYAARAAALAPSNDGPGEVLAQVNRVILAEPDGGTHFCTMVYLALEDSRAGCAGLRLRVASGGHPPVLLVRAGEGGVEPIKPAGGLVGVLPEMTFAEVELELHPGDLLLAFTDGVTEARRGTELFGDQRLEQLVTEHADEPLPALVARIEQAVVSFADGPLRDDLALVALRPVPAELTLALPAEPAQLGTLRRRLRQWLTATGWTEEEQEMIVLAASEAASNSIEHGYPEGAAPDSVEVRAELAGAELTLTVRDRGRWQQRRAPLAGRGRGLTMIRAAMGEVDVSTGAGGTEVRMRRVRSAGEEAAWTSSPS
jgi:PAS domain S-box-containing protein